jgi:hypothetical protein
MSPIKTPCLIFSFLVLASSSPAAIVAGWHSPDVSAAAANDSTPDTAEVAGVDGLLTGGADVQANEGSTDGSYGPEPIPGSPATANRIRVREGDSVTVLVTNNTATGLSLEQLLFDYDGFANAPKDLAITYSGGNLADASGTVVFSASNVVLNTTLNGDFPDYSVNLGDSLADTILASTESAAFTFTFTNANTTFTAGAMDNIAVSGTAVEVPPEPETPRLAVATVRKPNVVIFYADDIGLGDISVSGFATTEIVTPHIDSLAAQGMRFTDAHTAFSTCAPSRYSLLSGNMPFRGRRYNGTWGLQDPSQFLSGQRSMGHLFQDAGYRTAHIGKTHLGGGLYDGAGNLVPTADLSSVDWFKGVANGLNGYLGFDYSFISHDGIQGSIYVYQENEMPVTNFSYNPVAGTWSWSAATTQAYRYLTAGSPSDPATGTIDLDPDGNGVNSDVLFDTGSNKVYGYGDFDTTKAGQVFMQAAKNFIPTGSTSLCACRRRLPTSTWSGRWISKCRPLSTTLRRRGSSTIPSSFSPVTMAACAIPSASPTRTIPATPSSTTAAVLSAATRPPRGRGARASPSLSAGATARPGVPSSRPGPSVTRSSARWTCCRRSPPCSTFPNPPRRPSTA